MKVNGLGQVTTARVGSKKVRAGDGSFVDELDTGEVEASAAVSGATPVSAASSLLSLQEVPDSTDGRSRGLVRAEDMLEGLEEIRQGLLTGTIPVSSLQSLAIQARKNREAVDDPRLKSVLDDIELRAEVELAKLEYATS